MGCLWLGGHNHEGNSEVEAGTVATVVAMVMAMAAVMAVAATVAERREDQTYEQQRGINCGAIKAKEE